MLPLIAALACVFANAFFVAAEFALAKVRPTALETIANQGNNPQAKLAFKLTKELDAYLSATQLGITLASLALGWLGEPAIAHYLEALFAWLDLSTALAEALALPIAFGIISFLHIVVGELVPKSLALQRPEQVSIWSARLLALFYTVSFPALWLLNGSSNFVLRRLGLPAPQHAEGKLSAEELRLLIQASFSNRGIEGTKRELLERVLRATDRPVRACMIPRVDMRVLSLDDDFDKCIDEVQRYGFSRYPVAKDGDPDQVDGYVYVKDLIVMRGSNRNIGELRRDIHFVPESRTVGDLLTEFQATKIPIALVVDEYGGTSGLVTIEDLVEELVGDIQDELDIENPAVRAMANGTLIADGLTPIGDLDLDGLKAPPIEGAETLGAYVVASLGRLARPGDRINVGAYEIVVQDIRKRRVQRVALLPIRADEESPPEA